MKKLILLFVLGLALILTSVKNKNSNKDTLNFDTKTLVFDGYEGGHYFFTSNNDEAMSFDEIDNNLNYQEKLQNGDFLGKTFNVTYIKTTPHNFNNIIKTIKLNN